MLVLTSYVLPGKITHCCILTQLIMFYCTLEGQKVLVFLFNNIILFCCCCPSASELTEVQIITRCLCFEHIFLNWIYLLKHVDLRSTPSLELGTMLIFSYAPYGLAEGLKLSGKCARLYILLYFHVFLEAKLNKRN